MPLKILIPEHMPPYNAKVLLGLPPLPFTNTGAFQQLKIKPPGGGKINALANISGIGNGSVKLATKQRSTKRNRKVYTKPSQAVRKTSVPKAKKSKAFPGVPGKLVNGKKKRTVRSKRR